MASQAHERQVRRFKVLLGRTMAVTVVIAISMLLPTGSGVAQDSSLLRLSRSCPSMARTEGIWDPIAWFVKPVTEPSLKVIGETAANTIKQLMATSEMTQFSASENGAMYVRLKKKIVLALGCMIIARGPTGKADPNKRFGNLFWDSPKGRVARSITRLTDIPEFYVELAVIPNTESNPTEMGFIQDTCRKVSQVMESQEKQCLAKLSFYVYYYYKSS